MATDTMKDAERAERELNPPTPQPPIPSAPTRAPQQGTTTARDHVADSTMQPRPHPDAPATARRIDERG